MGLSSYDRLFPNQENDSIGGFGNLIALPLPEECSGRRCVSQISGILLSAWGWYQMSSKLEISERLASDVTRAKTVQGGTSRF
jgi:hypothetical protein